MGELPAARVTVGPVFAETGVDFAGPILTKVTVRSKKFIKSYVAVFVCFKVKCVHCTRNILDRLLHWE